ncbi:MAG: glycoside hydrolase family 9 protein [Prevotella sp.]|nr:glycoside hydrolase family 9 protein [Prevotella sp.]
MKRFLTLLALTYAVIGVSAQSLQLNSKDYLERRGVNVMVYGNPFSAIFYDEKRSGIDVIHHGVMTITNGGVRLSDTPEQWDLVPEMESRQVDRATGTVSVKLHYKEYDFSSEIKVAPKGEGFTISVLLDKPVPTALEGKAGFNLEFLPSAYWNHSYMADGQPAYFPRYASNDTELRPLSEKPMQVNNLITADLRGRKEFAVAKPMAEANTFVMAPDEPLRKVLLKSDTKIALYDGRILAQNGWFVARSILPTGKTGKVMEWYVEPNAVKGWKREPMIGFSQVGYLPDQQKEAVIELDGNDTQGNLEVWRVNAEGEPTLALSTPVKAWGDYLRYHYAKGDFSQIKEPGIYYLKYGSQKTNPFPIAQNVYEKVWHPSLDVWFPVQMDHMTVKEGYRVWHGTPHLDDVVQAPNKTPHFDNFEQGDSLWSPYKPFEYIPGFDRGGWFDAGDFDIETGSHCSAVMSMINTWENFRPERDETMIDQENRYVNIHFPDGRPDLLQQIEHGVLPVVAQVEKIGHACRGINHATLYQYNRLDEPSTITDNKHLTGDERWLFTYKPRGLDQQTCAALAATARVMKDFNAELSDRCLKAALKIWGDMRYPAPQAAWQLYLTTGEKSYIKDMEKNLLRSFNSPNRRFALASLPLALQAAPAMSKAFLKKLRPIALAYKAQLDSMAKANPYGVEVYGAGWGSNGQVISQGINNYWVNKYFPDIVTRDDVLRPASYLFGCHPFHNRSFVMGVGVRPKDVAYGNNRSDFTFIAGGVVPGMLLLQPDYIENKDDWPFFWGQNECTIGQNAMYLYYGNILSEMNK